MDDGPRAAAQERHMSPQQAVPLLEPHWRQAARALARAFFDEPGVVWLLPHEGKRKRFLLWHFQRELRYGHLYGEMHTTPGEPIGAAIWLPPDQPRFTVPRFLALGYGALPAKTGAAALIKFLASMGHLDRLHRQDAPRRHWYLATLGVDPPYQGQGIGGSLLQPVLARADAAGLPCYLETGREINVRFYRKHGFEVVRTGFAPLGGPRYWTMLRPPVG